jgi:eukaryotic-like serine/threonine-protein kinase
VAKIEPGIVLRERYKIVSLLGQGGMGEVYLAKDLSLDTQVAIKVNHNLNDTASNQFVREARLLAGIKHPNLPRVIDYFLEKDCQMLVMDYIPGDELRKIVEQKKKLKPELITKWAIELGEALTYLHNHKPPIFHRDIKPANIKLTPSGDVILVDFGIAKSGDPSKETQTGAWAFSPGFAPPEQVSGMRTGPYTDQYALAATIYYLYAGKAPVDSAQRMMGASEFIPLEMAAPKIPDHVNTAITRALSMKPADRFPSVADFITAFTSEQPSGSNPPTQKTKASNRKDASVPPTHPSTQTPKAKPRHRGGRIAFLVILILAGLLYLGYTQLGSLGLISDEAVAKTAFAIADQTLAAAAAVQMTPSPTEATLATITSAATTEIIPSATATIEVTETPTDSATLEISPTPTGQ